MSLLSVPLLLLIAGVIGAVGQAVAGYDAGGRRPSVGSRLSLRGA